ncbi:KOW domain-containing RNA-binding protein [Clostridium akagii]|uniref:KOW domain-containing RNA-binding protein n=1 Tax=Clostridium akagii TaxID=91623 RepID=UPI0004796324|nr:KOW domain-containing RNA-binding protein [Clostridium akagii]
MNNNYLGTVVYSKAGRDIDRKFIIMDIINEEYVYISDGDLRKVEKPKRKKMKHLIITDIVFNDVLSNKTVSNSEIRKFLQSLGSNKEA